MIFMLIVAISSLLALFITSFTSGRKSEYISVHKFGKYKNIFMNIIYVPGWLKKNKMKNVDEIKKDFIEDVNKFYDELRPGKYKTTTHAYFYKHLKSQEKKGNIEIIKCCSKKRRIFNIKFIYRAIGIKYNQNKKHTFYTIIFEKKS